MNNKNVLVLNVGSSSLKFSLFSKKEKIIGGKCDKIGKKDSYLEIQTQEIKNLRMDDFETALDTIINLLKEKNLEFSAIGHRVVHGGPISETSLIDNKVEKTIEEFAEFAPLHNPNQLKVITICKKYKIPQYAIFDTSFYANLPQVASDYPIPREIVKKYNIKKYGFHGISHKSVTRGLRGKTISCHLGNGSSITASINGKAIDTSMGLTPVAGVIMATRSGDVDPGLVIYLQSKGYDMNKILNHKSGSLAYSQNTDIRDILKNFENPQVRAGYEIQIYSIIKYIGSYAAAMNGVDNIIFTAGIGQHIPKVREDICKSLEFLGVKLNKIKNKNNSDIISSNDSKVKLFVKDPNEEEMIAKEVFDKIHK